MNDELQVRAGWNPLRGTSGEHIRRASGQKRCKPSLLHAAQEWKLRGVRGTGVIHHNADPRATLAGLSPALKPAGIMELMVYNRFHWVIPVAFQQAIRTFCASQGNVDFEGELSITRRIIQDIPKGLLLSGYLSRYGDNAPESMIADELLQPVLYSYTVESLEDMAASCGLEMLLPCLNQFDKETGNYSWNMKFSDPLLKEMYETLPDTRRWQISNLFLLESSPMLWFYVQRADSDQPIKSERQITNEFLDRSARAVKVKKLLRLKNDDGSFSDREVVFPRASRDARAKAILEKIRRAREVLTISMVASPPPARVTMMSPAMFARVNSPSAPILTVFVCRSVCSCLPC
jgi:hypothetical protein